MNDIEIAAKLLRQREGEIDAAWIERLAAVFQIGANLPEDAKADRVGERLWKRLRRLYEAEETGK